MKSHLGGQDRAQFPGTMGLRETLELNRESCCHGHKSRKERDRAVRWQIFRATPLVIRHLVRMGQKAAKGYDGS